MQKQNSTRLEDALREFLIAQEVDNCTAATLRWYRSIVGAFIAGRDQAVEDVTAADIRRYLLNLKAKEYSEATLHAHNRALHKFFAWAAREYTFPDPMRNIKYPAMPQPTPRAASMDDIKAMFDVASLRDRAIIAFLLDTGARAAGLCGLRMVDLDLASGRAQVTEKGGKTRLVMFTTFTGELLKEWFAERYRVEWVFHSDDALQMTPNALYQMLRRLARRAGVQGRFNPHSLRHAFAREYIRAGGDLPTLAKLLGHRDVSTTVNHYAIFTDRELQEAHERYSPAKRLGESEGKNEESG